MFADFFADDFIVAIGFVGGGGATAGSSSSAVQSLSRLYALCGFVAGGGGVTAGASSSSAVQSLSRFQCGQLVRLRASSSVMRPVDAPGSSIMLGRRACAVVATSARRPTRMLLVYRRDDAGWAS